MSRPKGSGLPPPSEKDRQAGDIIDTAVRSFRVRQWLEGSRKVADRPLLEDVRAAGYDVVRTATQDERRVQRTLAEEAIRGCALEIGLDLADADRLAEAAAPHLDRLVEP